jgi:hypothetical protein
VVGRLLLTATGEYVVDLAGLPSLWLLAVTDPLVARRPHHRGASRSRALRYSGALTRRARGQLAVRSAMPVAVQLAGLASAVRL